MIIKSMSRRSKSFSQLYDYLMRDKTSFSFTRNSYCDSKNKKELIKEFLDNYKYLKNSRGKVSLYHEVLSLHKNNLSKQRQKEILFDLANKYLQSRANNHLSFGVIHEDKNNIHVHLMISSNELESDKRLRLSKKDFLTIQKNIELYKNQNYKELENSSIYQEKKDLSKDKQKEQEIKHKRNSQTIKDKIKEDLENTFKRATSKTYLDNHLKNLGYEIYQRGQTIGLIFENKKYRLKTLGLDREYQTILKEFEKIKDREIKRQRFKEERVQENTRWKEVKNNDFRKRTTREKTKSYKQKR